MWSNFCKKLKDVFSPISLTELNATASFLDRVETKFIVTEQQLIAIIPELQKDYYILEIGDTSLFQYDNVYMDTQEYDFYQEHQAGKKIRTKVRTREYIDSGHAFFEYKQKQDDFLRKFRYPISLRNHGKMTKESECFYNGISMSFNGRKKQKKLSKSLRTEYTRLTLCSKDSTERVTIDFNIQLISLREKEKSHVLKNVVIMESKSKSKNCKSHKIMEKYGIKKASSCSKYCLGLILNDIFTKKGKFKDTIKVIESMS